MWSQKVLRKLKNGRQNKAGVMKIGSLANVVDQTKIEVTVVPRKKKMPEWIHETNFLID